MLEVAWTQTSFCVVGLEVHHRFDKNIIFIKNFENAYQELQVVEEAS